MDMLNSLYSNNSYLNDKSYEEQLSVIYKSNCMYSDSFSRAMNSLGNKAFDFYSDFEILQKAWAHENGLEYEEDSWKEDIVLGQISHYRPEVIYFQDTENLPRNIREILKERFPFIRLVVLYSGYPSRLDELHDIDLLIAGTPRLVEQYKTNGIDPSLVYHGFDQEVLSKMETNNGDQEKYDFTFVGSSGYGYGMSHQSRYWALKELKEKTNIHLWLEERDDLLSSKSNLKPYGLFKRLIKRLLGIMAKKIFSSDMHIQNNEIEEDSIVPVIPLKKIFKGKCYSASFGLDMYTILAKSKVVFNMHTDAAEGVVGNMRMFESTGIGTCLLTDTGSNMADLFVEDQEVVTYNSIDECIEKSKYLLDNEAHRQEIALAGQKRTLKDHTLMQRYAEIDQLIKNHL
tara:strand:+ start:4 stop:1206 length:1203 start_codon:yes stop_codon:yes gene_type:complete